MLRPVRDNATEPLRTRGATARVTRFSTAERRGREDYREHDRHTRVLRAREHLAGEEVRRLQAQLVEEYFTRTEREREAMREYYRELES